MCFFFSRLFCLFKSINSSVFILGSFILQYDVFLFQHVFTCHRTVFPSDRPFPLPVDRVVDRTGHLVTRPDRSPGDMGRANSSLT